MQAPIRTAAYFLHAAIVVALSASSSAQNSVSSDGDDDRSDDQRLEEVLTQRGSVEFAEKPLREVAETLSRRFGAPILLAPKKLAEAGVSPDTPVTKSLQNSPLESILRLILDDLELGFTIRDGVILITTPDDVESQLITRVYPVLDLVALRLSNGNGGGWVGRDYDSLIEVITSTIKPDSWDDVGGPGAIDSLDNAAALVISQTRDVHRQVGNLLSSLRRVKAEQGISSMTIGSGVVEQPFFRGSAGKSARLMQHATQTWQMPKVYPAAE